MTTAGRGRVAVLAVLLALTVVAVVCTEAAETAFERLTWSGCRTGQSAPVPSDQFVLTGGGIAAAALAVTLYVLLRVRDARTSRSSDATSRIGLVAAVIAGVFLIAACNVQWQNYSQAEVTGSIVACAVKTSE